MPKYTQKHTVTNYEVGHKGLTTMTSLALFFQESASNHARVLGFAGERLWQNGLAWVLSRLYISVTRYPAAGETITIRTWPSSHEKKVALRCYEILDASNTCIVHGTSAWVVIDMNLRRIVPIPSYVADGYPKDMPECAPFPSKVVPKLREPIDLLQRTIHRSDLDMNGHTNNAKYIEMILDSIPEELSNQDIRLLDITFRKESTLNELLTVQSNTTADSFSIFSKTQNAELCRVQTIYTAT